MNKKCFIDYETYHWLLTNLNSHALHDGTSGKLKDLDFIKDDKWLTETSVIDHVCKRNGTWCIDLVFAAYKQPLKLIIRKITAYSCRKKALLHGSIFRRQAAKDQRGTLTITIEDFNISQN
ncbi:MAG TPA: hypothetical protein PKD85_15285 [Saprospiraceae bacterium]|nr:hypothetical protein [Saprospiraceae bacterium]